MAPKRFLVFIFIFADIGLCFGYETTREERYEDEELPCLTIGGLCVLSTECPDDKRVPIKGLCPVQQKNGIECCHALPISETRCQKRGGECIEKQRKCPPNLTFLRATDCGAREKCCILVN